MKVAVRMLILLWLITLVTEALGWTNLGFLGLILILGAILAICIVWEWINPVCLQKPAPALHIVLMHGVLSRADRPLPMQVVSRNVFTRRWDFNK